MPDDVRILTTTRASPNGTDVYRYVAGRVYGSDTDPPMPPDLAAVFVREGWGKRCGGEQCPEPSHDVTVPAEPEPAAPPPEPGAACLWCGAAYARQATGGTAQRFCSAGCRQTFHTAARRYVAREIDEGRLEVATLRKLEEQRARSS